MKTMIAVVVALFVLAPLVATAGAAPTRSERVYFCTVTSRQGGAAFGVHFWARNRFLVRVACDAFVKAAGPGWRHVHSFRVPRGWTWVARYAHHDPLMVAESIAPRRLKRLVFAVTNRPVFLAQGWVLLSRHR